MHGIFPYCKIQLGNQWVTNWKNKNISQEGKEPKPIKIISQESSLEFARTNNSAHFDNQMYFLR